MNRKPILILGAIIIGLVLLMLVSRTHDGNNTQARRALLPDFPEHANAATQITIQGPNAAEATLQKVDERWVVSSRDNFPADLGKLRQLIIALADARIVEEKTADPEQYEKLGLDMPGQDSGGTQITVAGPDFSYTVVLGTQAQGKFRYARVEGEAASYLIDQNPTPATTAGDWLQTDLLDISAQRVQGVSILHADGESIVIAKQDQEQTDFRVQDIPTGRELSYPTVANSIGGALSALQLEDVRASVAATPVATVEFQTFDGYKIDATAVAEGDKTWVSFVAAVSNEDADAAASVSTLNERLQGWQFMLPDYKKNQLLRRWNDILKAAD